MHQRYIAVENIVRKGEIACYKQFLLFTQCFPPYTALIFHFKCILKSRLQFDLIWTSLKFCRLVMGYDALHSFFTKDCSMIFILIHVIVARHSSMILVDSLVCSRQKIHVLTRRQILDSSKLKEFADDNFKFDKNGRKLHKLVENTVGKGEIAL